VVTLARLAALRQSRFLSQAELAKLAGVSKTTINRLEHGGHAQGRTVRKLAQALGVEPVALVTEERPDAGGP
jgi:transcriptional regulator with XRE-family HTH domain